MKKKILCLLLTVLLICSVASGLCACAPKDPPPAGGAVGKISASLLDGKIANFLGAEGLGLKDKSKQPSAFSLDSGSGFSAFSAVAFDEQSGDSKTQKKNELVKDTEDGHKDVHFYSAENGRSSYKDLNKQFNNHHHKGEECKNANCDLISDEIEQQEQEDTSNTIISLDARINKLYNYGDFTFFSVSSAVEGEIRIRNERKTQQPFMVNAGDEMIVVNAGNGAQASDIGVSLIILEDGAIPIKEFENDLIYHVANYWSDNYNQSYITDNKTGKTYSLSQFPRIFSVENGVIKVYNENANGKFDYYEPKIVDGEMEFVKIALPDASEFRIGFNTFVNVLKSDKYGNKLIESRERVDDSVDHSYDKNGEKKIGEKFIGAARLNSVYNPLQQQSMGMNGIRGLQTRYLNATRYHLGSDGRIYRLNFTGNLSEISVNVLNEKCEWQNVESTAEVTFEGVEGFILWSYSAIDSLNRDYFRITKISDGYAYYSSAATTDGGMVWQAHVIGGASDIEKGEYSGVVKIPTSGPVEVQEGFRYEHLEPFYELAYQGMRFERYKVFLVADTQMVILFGQEDISGKMIFIDVETGAKEELGSSRFLSFDECSVWFENYGWLSLVEEIDFDNFNPNEIFTEEPIDYRGELDAYFKLVTDKISA